MNSASPSWFCVCVNYATAHYNWVLPKRREQLTDFTSYFKIVDM